MIYHDFITTFPEFKDLSIYPKERVSFWLEYAKYLVNEDRWHELYDHGVSLLTAHQLKLYNMGENLGLDSGQSADGVSYQVDYSNIIIANAGLYNRTAYGIQYYQLAMMMGSGGMYYAN